MASPSRAAAGGGPRDVWADEARYEAYVGRWSREVARSFVAWLGVPAGVDWLDVGCGTGALSAAVLERCAPRALLALDRSAPYAAGARRRLPDRRARFAAADAQALPVPAAGFDAAASGLVLNFVPRPERMLSEMARAVRPGAAVALYVWDYAGRMEMLRHFWDAAAALDPAGGALDEGRRFPQCTPEALAALFRGAGLADVEVRAIDVPTVFRDFDDYWAPFLGGQGPAPGYLLSLDASGRDRLREEVRRRLPIGPGGGIAMIARAWAARGTRAAATGGSAS